jgi:folate-binding protein YgfZ
LEAEPLRPVYVIFGTDALPDPRHPLLGSRSLIKPDLPELPFEAWDELRIRLNIADGSRDAELEKSTLEELNMADTAVSFTKGCYVGQELTARMEHRGLGKRHLHALGFAETSPAYGTPILLADGTEIGEMRSGCGHIGMALLRDDALEELRKNDDTHFVYLLGR